MHVKKTFFINDVRIRVRKIVSILHPFTACKIHAIIPLYQGGFSILSVGLVAILSSMAD